jgi:hypothetical protein
MLSFNSPLSISFSHTSSCQPQKARNRLRA